MRLSQAIATVDRALEARSGLAEVELHLGQHRHTLRLPASGALQDDDISYILRRASTLRWIHGRGDYRCGDPRVSALLAETFTNDGPYAFEVDFFESLDLPPDPTEDIVPSGEVGIFLDLGGSSRKCLVFERQQLAYQSSEPWEPFACTTLAQLRQLISEFLLGILGSRSPDSVGTVAISCPGICEGGALLASTLSQGLADPAEYDPWFLKRAIRDLFPNASYRLVNDGSVTSLPFRPGERGTHNTLSLVMGTNLGGGHSQLEGIHELHFIPFSTEADVVDVWSGYRGVATSYFSKSGILRLAARYGYDTRDARACIEQLHRDQRHGFRGARELFQTMGRQVGAFIAQLRDFYEIDAILLSGGILNAAVVDEMRAPYSAAFREITGSAPPPMRMLSLPGISPEFNQAWTLAMNHFHHSSGK